MSDGRRREFVSERMATEHVSNLPALTQPHGHGLRCLRPLRRRSEAVKASRSELPPHNVWAGRGKMGTAYLPRQAV